MHAWDADTARPLFTSVETGLTPIGPAPPPYKIAISPATVLLVELGIVRHLSHCSVSLINLVPLDPAVVSLRQLASSNNSEESMLGGQCAILTCWTASLMTSRGHSMVASRLERGQIGPNLGLGSSLSSHRLTQPWKWNVVACPCKGCEHARGGSTHLVFRDDFVPYHTVCI